MAVPGYQDFMLPILKLAAVRETTLTEALKTLADQLHISPVDQERMLPSGVQTQYKNRVSWAITYLTKSLLIEKTGRARFRIAPRGKEVLETNPSSIDNSFLDQFPEYQAFKVKKRVKADDKADLSDPEITPDEHLDIAYRELREALADELLSRVRNVTPKFFEHLVVDLLVAMGYGGRV